MYDAYWKNCKKGSGYMKMVEVIDKNIITYSPQFVRETVFKKLVNVAKKAPAKLILYEGFRPIEKQIQMFEKQKEILRKENPKLTEEELKELTNKYVAIHERAVHITGGAVDVTLEGYNMGTDYLCFDGRQATSYYDEKDEKISANRKILCDLMETESFVNFYNEWWHFEYGCSLWYKKHNCEPIYDIVKNLKEEML